MVERQQRLDAMLEQAVDQPLVEIEPGGFTRPVPSGRTRPQPTEKR